MLYIAFFVSVGTIEMGVHTRCFDAESKKNDHISALKLEFQNGRIGMWSVAFCCSGNTRCKNARKWWMRVEKGQTKTDSFRSLRKNTYPAKTQTLLFARSSPLERSVDKFDTMKNSYSICIWISICNYRPVIW